MTSPRNGVIAVIGGGRMGAGIAQVFAGVGYDVVVAEGDPAAAAAARDRIRASLERASAKGALTEPVPDVLDRLTVVPAIGELPADACLLVEAVPENPELKRDVLIRAAAVVGENCVLASNTSSLSITELGAGLPNPGRFIGMHFFNPVPASTLVEVVVGDRTDPRVAERATDWVGQLGKQSIVVRDSPGFATSRLGVLLGLEAIRMLEEGVADAASIDRAMELGYRHPMGPLRSTDLVGLDVRLAIADHLAATLGDRFRAPQLLRDKVARGELGRKSGQGFFTWP
ncbi:3-hydroxybutyryl-CoA dehydrogenase [Nakamurella panacisegetis]|uniref:3-hydroxybutyryl-CoA dehydrogenase n=1 Tax=Nakamurella panacisegetis TaxID=1090615 RepID=A0A1H0NGM8_9ACTN|nr:3-hydroxyacyl-CoA dehydrogenase family protein [Nakamurella panacisegetis]SDO91575.1 3-hydroxybutyryl-CoA dehydrogenase [Nakamurella panacisegetis]